MGNIAYITTKKHLKSYDITELLEKVNKKRFDGKMTITKDQYSWKVGYPGMRDYLDFYPASIKKLSCKHPHDPWMSYVFVVFQEELAKLVGGILSDEGVDEKWKPKPQKYPSYDKWVALLYSNTIKKHPKDYRQILEMEFSCVPKGMENY
jgi:hypothetical protein